ncbi:hypothetical protein HanXRQr2_Chr16g0759961 [Helianthus annuus]|uniref:Uncharacterized protein n=1 Tax=Helianthus annuus TaxID=4232 RepID=A0A9K3DVE7_HELAN|nr:hypothetical protein HanXRQr2_Chr16g0759961 [Helianthus annuus]KAJ0822125.1 hypothetical protein HanPSC8_Chr16g0728251 [Helianthus annuus]
MTSLRSLYLRVLVLGEGAPVGDFLFSDPSSRSCSLILSPEYSDRRSTPARFLEEPPCLELLMSSAWHQSQTSGGSPDSLHTSVGSGGGTLYIGKSCQRNQHHRTCNILFQHPPLYIHIYICILLRSLPLSFRERNKTCRDV